MNIFCAGTTIIGLIIASVWIAYLIKNRNKPPLRGTVKNLQHAYKGLMSNPVTAFEIHTAKGDIHYGGFAGHEHELHEGQEIEFEMTWTVSSRAKYQTTARSDDGKITHVENETYYYELKWYRPVVIEIEFPETE